MKIIVTNVCQPIPICSCDWQATWDGMEEDGPYGHGATREQAINDLFDNTDVDDLAAWFDIEAREFGASPEDYYWVASTPKGEHVASAWRDAAIVDLAYKLAEVV